MKKITASFFLLFCLLFVTIGVNAEFTWSFNSGKWPVFYELPENTTLTGKYQGSVGGKTSTDKSFVFNANGEAVLCENTGKYLQYNGAANSGISIDSTTTLETNVFLSGNGKFLLKGKITSPDAWYTYLELTSSGEIKAADGSGNLSSVGKTELNRWHKAVLVFSVEDAAIKIYFDGEQVGSISCALSGRKAGYVQYVLKQDVESNVVGKLAVDDLAEYVGAYVPENDRLTVRTQSDDLQIDIANNKIYYSENIYSSLSNRVKSATDARTAVMYIDDTMVLTKYNTKTSFSTYHYFDLEDISKAFSHEIVPVSLVRSEGMLYLKAETEGRFIGNVSVYLAGYDEDGALVSVEKCDADPEVAHNYLKIKALAKDGITYRAYMWEDSKPLCDACDMSVNEGAVLMNTGFEPGERIPFMLASSRYENYLNTVTDKGNTIVKFMQINNNSFHLDGYLDESYANNITYEFDFRLKDEKSAFSMLLKDTYGQYLTPCEVKNKALYVNNTKVSDIASFNEWNKISVSCDHNLGVYYLYLNNELLGSYNNQNTGFNNNGSYVSVLRLMVSEKTNSGDYSSFDADNFRAYEESEPCMNIGDFLRKTPLFNKSVFNDTGYITEERIYSDYSDMNTSHPRIQANTADFARIRSNVISDTNMSNWYNSLIAFANNALSKGSITYSFDSSNPMLMEAKDVLDDIYALSMAYRITNDERYLNKAKSILKNVCSFGDWMPSNHLTVAEMSAAVSIGYDWLYDGLTEDDRSYIEEAIYNNAIYDYLKMYRDTSGPMENAANNDMNHSVVCNSAAFMTAMAFMDVYPDECKHIASEALRGINMILYRFAPDGAWFEGPHYWEYTMQYLTKLLSTQEKSLGTDYGISSAEGISVSQKYIMAMQSDIAIFNYGDGTAAKMLVPEIIYLSKLSGDNKILSAFMQMNDNNPKNAEDAALSLLWYDGNMGTETENKDFVFYDEGVASMRDSWGRNETFAAVRAGALSDTHSDLDAGTFVYDYAGIRWAKDYGAGNYAANGYWDKSENGGRWKSLEKRAEAHNTIVINPSLGNEYPVNYNTSITLFDSNEDETTVIMNLTSAQSKNANSAQRGFIFTDNKKSLVIRDEISLKSTSDLYWFMQTDANVEIVQDGAVLTQGGKSIALDFVTDAQSYEISCAPISPLVQGSVLYNNCSGNRIMIRLHASDDVNITVKLTPRDINGTDVSEYNIPLTLWKQSDIGKIGLVSNNALIDVSSGRDIGVYSNPTQSSYQFTGRTLVSALSESTGGYTLSVVKENLRTAVTFTKVYEGCYLKAVKGSDVIYVPIYETKCISRPDTDMFRSGYKVTDKTTLLSVGGIGGKDANDVCALFTLTDNLQSGSVVPRIQRDNLSNDNVYSYETEVYVSGDATAVIIQSLPSGGNPLIKISADGTVYYNKDGTMTQYSKKLTTSSGWHKVSLIFDKPRGRMHIYCDGTFLTDLTGPFSVSMTGLRFGVDSGSTGSCVGYDNFTVYKGFKH